MTTTSTKKKKRRGRPPGSKSVKKKTFTFEDKTPMGTTCTDVGIYSSVHSSYDDYENNCDEDEEDGEDEIICCVCHCAVDYSDESLFESANGSGDGDDNCNDYAVNDREDKKIVESIHGKEKNSYHADGTKQYKKGGNSAEEEDIITETKIVEKPPLLPRNLYDPQNGILLCDTPGCNRAYHQRCHFVPVFVIPRGDWHCLICSYGQSLHSSRHSVYSPSKERTPPTTSNEIETHHTFQQSDLMRLFQAKLYQVTLQEEESKEKLLDSFVVSTLNFAANGSAMARTDSAKNAPAIIAHNAHLLSETAANVVAASSADISPNFIPQKTDRVNKGFDQLDQSLVHSKQTLSFKSSPQSSPKSPPLVPSITNHSLKPVSLDNIKDIYNRQSADNGYFSTALQRSLIPLDQLQKQFEHCASMLKSSLLHLELTTRIKSTINQSLARIRRSQDTLRAYTETDRSRKSILSTYEKTQRLPQEIVQSFSNLAKGKLKIRETLESLDKFIKGHDDVGMLLSWLRRKEGKRDNDAPGREKVVDSIVEKYPFWFSAEVVSNQRIVPRISSHTKEQTNSDENGHASQNGGSDDEDLIETDDLACAVCFCGTSTDTNDLLLCDGEGCNRCFHMNCVTPRVTQQELEDDKDGSWFCPYCTNLAVLVHYAQVEYLGDEWEERLRRKEQYKRHHQQDEEEDNEDNESTSSWDNAADVFPEAEYENAVAVKWGHGVRDKETDDLLSSFLGCFLGKNNQNFGGDENSADVMILDGDDEDEDEDEDYDEDEEKEATGNDDNSLDTDESNSDETSLEDMSSIECGVDKSELDALSSCSSLDSGDNEEEEDASAKKTKTRRSKRAQRHNNSSANKATPSSLSSREKKDVTMSDVGDLDEANILLGKRRRTKVDYRRLNDAMFGDVTAMEAAILFGEDDDYHYYEQEADGSGKRKRGRSRKNPPHLEEVKDVAKKQNSVKQLNNGATPQKRGRPPKKMPIEEINLVHNVGEAASSSLSPRVEEVKDVNIVKQLNNGATPKKRGRPPKKMPIEEINLVHNVGEAASSSLSPGKKRRGRPPKNKDSEIKMPRHEQQIYPF